MAKPTEQLLREAREGKDESKRLAPCDCKDWANAERLNEQGIGFNEYSLEVKPNVVVISTNDATLRIPMRHFERFARWYLEPQEIGD